MRKTGSQRLHTEPQNFLGELPVIRWYRHSNIIEHVWPASTVTVKAREDDIYRCRK